MWNNHSSIISKSYFNFIHNKHIFNGNHASIPPGECFFFRRNHVRIQEGHRLDFHAVPFPRPHSPPREESSPVRSSAKCVSELFFISSVISKSYFNFIHFFDRYLLRTKLKRLRLESFLGLSRLDFTL